MEQASTSTPQAATYADLRTINVNEHIEKKNGLSYLSWAWAVDQLLIRDPAATWDYRVGTDYVRMTETEVVEQHVPYIRIGETAMVFCTVSAFGVKRTAQLPVMDHRNKPIPNPDAFQVNTAMQRCLAKAIALHGIGLYIYAGEDIPADDTPAKPEPTLTVDQLKEYKAALDAADNLDELTKVFTALVPEGKAALREYATACKKKFKVAA